MKLGCHYPPYSSQVNFHVDVGTVLRNKKLTLTQR